MVRHIVTWAYKDGFSAEENALNAQKVKSGLEGLRDCVPGIFEMDVYIDVLPSSDRDMVLNSLFVNEESLAAYQTHPEHLRVSAFVGTVTQGRACVDYYEPLE